MCWDLSSSSSRYLAAMDPAEAVGRGHYRETKGYQVFFYTEFQPETLLTCQPHN